MGAPEGAYYICRGRPMTISHRAARSAGDGARNRERKSLMSECDLRSWFVAPSRAGRRPPGGAEPHDSSWFFSVLVRVCP